MVTERGAAQLNMTAPDPRAVANRRGILYMASAMVCLVANDMLMKRLGQSMPLPQMVFLRGAMAVLMVLAVAHALGATRQLKQAAGGRVVVRAVADAMGTLLYLGSLMHLPLANATAINLAAPLMMALFAVLFLHESAGPRRWLAIGAGFAGVLLVIQPRAEGFNVWSLVCLSGTVFQAGRELLTRRIDPGVPSILITLSSVACVTLMAGAGTLWDGWQPVARADLGGLAMAAALLASGYWLIVNSMRHGEMSLVAPFRYTGLLVAVVLGYAVWGDVPDVMAWTGIALLLAAGVRLLQDERRRARAEGPPLA